MSKPPASTSTVFAARSSGRRAVHAGMPSERQNPSASSSSWPGVLIVTATGPPPTRISSGSSTARRSTRVSPPGRRNVSAGAAAYGGTSSAGFPPAIARRVARAARHPTEAVPHPYWVEAAPSALDRRRYPRNPYRWVSILRQDIAAGSAARAPGADGMGTRRCGLSATASPTEPPARAPASLRRAALRDDVVENRAVAVHGRRDVARRNVLTSRLNEPRD